MPTPYEAWLRSMNPADRESAEQAIFGAITRRSPEYRAEYRTLLPSGDERWLDAIGKVGYAAWEDRPAGLCCYAARPIVEDYQENAVGNDVSLLAVIDAHFARAGAGRGRVRSRAAP